MRSFSHVDVDEKAMSPFSNGYKGRTKPDPVQNAFDWNKTTMTERLANSLRHFYEGVYSSF